MNRVRGFAALLFCNGILANPLMFPCMVVLVAALVHAIHPAYTLAVTP